ncbi:MAG TPA: choice-of-anchor tandem repeat GloVer-containing protein, partial [Bacteroidia bacterium]|nr:choice-of-anchor tandem repeat GloVer-containing protein [Bacteroidia bacterium]
FDGTNTGGHPYGSLLEAGDGNLYGLTTSGGSNDFGVLFQYNPSSSLLETKINFNSTGNGANPQSSLMLANNGLLYGTTEYGGTADEGIIFEYDPQTSVCTKKHEFNNEKDQNGQYPLGELMQASDGMLYGMSYTGGIAGVGVLFKYDPSTATYSKEFDFHAAPEGNIPTSSLLLASDKMFYGVAQSGGRTNDGAIYQYDPVFDSYVKKFDFDKNSSGSFPTGALMQASDGKIYGTTTQGGTNDLGVLFQFDPVTSAYTVKVTFDQVNGSSPYGELLQANDGKIYGMTREGGTHGNGVLFQFDPLNSNYTKKFDFDDVNGKYPEGGLMQAGDGKLYGVTTAGGSNTTPDLADGLGVLFQFDPATSIYTKKIDFDGTNNGSNPNGTLVTGPDGKLYGMTTYGGLIDADHPLGSGTLFQYDPASSGIEGKINFNGTQNGSKPNGSLLLASDGNFYGVTFAGGIFNMGILFQLDPMTFSFHKKVDFKKSIGKLCDHGKLTEITTVNSVADHSIATLHLNTYPNPAKDQVTLSIDKPIYNATVSIYTTSGQLVVKKTNVNGNRFILPISDLAKGTYFIEVTENENHSGIKLVKE